jgi:hypothetical protein
MRSGGDAAGDPSPYRGAIVMHRLASADLWSGLLCAVFGSAFILAASRYEVGSAAAMGPGYFPIGLGGVLIAFGAVLVIKSNVGEPDRHLPLVLRPAAIIIGALVLFGLLLDRAGLILSGMVLVTAGSVVTDRFSWLQLAVFGIALTAFVAVLFTVVLGVPVVLWPAL